MKPLIAILLLSVASFAQTFHVTGVREWTITDPPRTTQAFRTYVITGTMNETRYTAQQTFSWGSQRFEPGKDYEVTKADAKTLTVLVQDKKGRKNKELLHITGAESTEK